MKYKNGDRVKLTEAIEELSIPKGTEGTVSKVLPITERYRVDFDNGQNEVLVPETKLTKA